jgi:HEAT repeat protein
VPAPPAPPKKWDARWEKLLLPLLKGGAAGPAARAVGEVMGQKAVPHLLKLLDPKSKFAQGDIAGVLGKLKARAAVPKLIELLSRGRNDYFDLCDALETIGDPSAIAPLRELIAKAKDHSQKYWLEHCAERLEESKTEAKQ